MFLKSKRIYQFGDFELKVGSRSLMRDGRQVPLGSKAFEVLTCLVVRAGELVTKDELLKVVWPDSFVEESNLAQHISALRKALGNESDFIVTVPGRGYQFTAAVREIAPEETPVLPEPQDEIVIHKMRERAHILIEESAPRRLPMAAGNASRRVWTYGALAAVAIAIAAIAGWRWSRRPIPSVYQQVVLADFVNTTGDPTFDRLLNRALEIDLSQSPFVNVMSEREAVSTLQLMGQKGDAAMTPDIAREVCERSNRQVLLAGSISAIGREYLLTLEASDCHSGKKLAGAKAEAASKEQVLAAVDSIAGHVRTGLGESAQSLEKYEVPIQQATTPSLEALKAYSTGVYLEAHGKDPIETMPLYQRAIELDPNFAMAYGILANSYYNLAEFGLASQYYKKAFDLSDRVSAREKLVLRAHYYSEGQNDLQRGVQIYQVWATTYPQDQSPPINLVNTYTQMGDYSPAIAIGEEAIKTRPDSVVLYSVLVRALKQANRFPEAKGYALQAEQRGKDQAGLHSSLFEIALFDRDPAEIERETQWAATHRDSWYDWCFADLRGLSAASAGKRIEAEEFLREAAETATRENLSENVDDIWLDAAQMELELGFPDAARLALTRVHKGIDSPALALLQGRLGDRAFAERFLAAHSKDPGTLMTYVDLPLLRAQLAMEESKPAEAIAALEPAAPFELVDYRILSQRGEAYLRARQGDLAAQQYKKILANPGIDVTSPLYSLAHLGLARAYVMGGDVAAGRAEYVHFLSEWKDADADSPVVRVAKGEMAGLR